MSDYRKMQKMFERKPGKLKKFLKTNKPKHNHPGLGQVQCRRCGIRGLSLIQKYDLNYCRRCFREVAHDIGFRKYS